MHFAERLADWGPRPPSKCWRARRHSRPRAAQVDPPRDRRARLRHAAATSARPPPRRWRRASRTTDPRPGLPEFRKADRRAVAVASAASRATPTTSWSRPGAKPIMFFAMLALLEEGDEVLYPESRLPDLRVGRQLPQRARGAAACCAKQNGFDLDLKELESKVTSRTKLLVLNSPHNPTGAVLKPETVEAIAALRAQARLPHPRRRDLRPHPVRGTPPLDRLAARHGRAHDRARRLLQDLRR